MDRHKKRTLVIRLAVLLLVVGAAWAMGFFSGTDPALAELNDLRDQMRAAPEDQRSALRQQFRQRMEGLTDEQRAAYWQNSRSGWVSFGRERLNEFFELSPQEQQQQLDALIDRIVARRQERAANPTANNGGGRGGGWGGGGNRTEAQRDQRRKEMISRTDPKLRAQFDQFRDMMRERMQERGIEGGGRGFFRGS